MQLKAAPTCKSPVVAGLLHAQLTQAKVSVAGVSPQSAQSHAAFAAKYALPFTLICDPDKKVARAYDVIGPLGFGVRRASFLISPARIIEDALLADLRIGQRRAGGERVGERLTQCGHADVERPEAALHQTVGVQGEDGSGRQADAGGLEESLADAERKPGGQVKHLGRAARSRAARPSETGPGDARADETRQSAKLAGDGDDGRTRLAGCGGRVMGVVEKGPDRDPEHRE